MVKGLIVYNIFNNLIINKLLVSNIVNQLFI